jgi:ribosomal-protein-alanine N-acetyltransferase
VFAFLRPLSDPTHSARLDGPRVYLRAPRGGDWRAWSEIRTASRRFLEPWEPTWPNGAVTRAAYRNRLRRQLRESRDGTGYAFFIFRAADDALLGGVTLSNVQRGVAMSCSLGYWVGEQHTRQGVMSEAITSLLPFVFGTLGLHRLEAACLPSNVASQRLLRKLGFHEEGYARAYLRINGQWHDHLLFAMLANDRDEKKA